MSSGGRKTEKLPVLVSNQTKQAPVLVATCASSFVEPFCHAEYGSNIIVWRRVYWHFFEQHLRSLNFHCIQKGQFVSFENGSGNGLKIDLSSCDTLFKCKNDGILWSPQHERRGAAIIDGYSHVLIILEAHAVLGSCGHVLCSHLAECSRDMQAAGIPFMVVLVDGDTEANSRSMSALTSHGCDPLWLHVNAPGLLERLFANTTPNDSFDQ